MKKTGYHILSLFIIPGVLYLLFGKTVDFNALGKILAFIIIIPMYLAYKTYKSGSKVFNFEKPITNVCLGIIIFISMSINRDVFLSFSFDGILYVYLACFQRSLRAACVDWAFRRPGSAGNKARIGDQQYPV